MLYQETNILKNRKKSNNLDILRSKIKWMLSPYPSLFIPLYRVCAPSSNIKLLISYETQVVIEGFPRSGNTFAVVAFEMAQDQPIKIAHHLHVEAQIIEGVRRSLPVIVLIRNPIDAIRSYHVRHPEINVTWAFNRYISFYKAVKEISSKVVIANFEDVTRNYAEIIRHVNDKYNLQFGVFEHNGLNTQLVFQQVETLNNLIEGGKVTNSSIPSKERSELYKKIVLDVPSLLKNQALDIYYFLTQTSF